MDLEDLGFRDLFCIYAANSLAAVMHLQHNLHCFGRAFLKYPLQNQNHEIHGGVIVIKQDYTVELGLLNLNPLF